MPVFIDGTDLEKQTIVANAKATGIPVLHLNGKFTIQANNNEEADATLHLGQTLVTDDAWNIAWVLSTIPVTYSKPADN